MPRWPHFVLMPFNENAAKEVEQKWKTAKLYFRDYKRCSRPFSIDLEVAIRGFDIDNMAAQKAIDGSSSSCTSLADQGWHYRLKKHVLPDVRDGQDTYDDAGASASDAILHPQEWDDDYSMGH